jgi:hypothetical protein
MQPIEWRLDVSAAVDLQSPAGDRHRPRGRRKRSRLPAGPLPQLRRCGDTEFQCHAQSSADAPGGRPVVIAWYSRNTTAQPLNAAESGSRLMRTRTAAVGLGCDGVEPP